MKFCYVDESGKGSEPVLVLAGIIADAHRMHVTKSDWLGILKSYRATSKDLWRNFIRGTSTSEMASGAV